MRKLRVGIALVLTLAVGVTGGFFGRPSIVRDGLVVTGWLTAVAYSAACQEDQGAFDQAFGHYVATQTLKRQLVKALMPELVWADAVQSCHVKAFVSKRNLIVNAGETALRDCFNNDAGTECADVIKTLKFHGIGTGTVDPAEGDTGCGTELTTQYNPDSTRATGSQATNGANVYRTIGTNTIDSGTPAVTEWCLLNVATGAGVMWSRVEFAAINLVANDSLQTTYDLTIE